MTSTATALSTAQIIGRHRRPDRDPWFIDAVMDEWWQKYQDDGLLEREMAIPGLPIRASWAGKCARQVAYNVAGAEETNPTTAPDAWNFALGQYIHELAQHAVAKLFPGSETEVVTQLGEIGSGHGDMLVVVSKGQLSQFPEGARVAVEIKSVGGTKFKMGTEPNKGQGASPDSVMQCALNAAHMDPIPDYMLIVNLSKENVSVDMARKWGLRNEYMRFGAQWTYTQEEFLTIARDEMERLARIVETTRKRGPEAVPRVIPDPHMPAHVVTNPAKGTIKVLDEDGNTRKLGWAWNCSYCNFQDRCDRDR